MAKAITVKRGAWVILGMLLILGGFALSLNSVVDSVNAAIFDNRWLQTRLACDLLGDLVDDYVRLDEDWGTYDYASDFDDSISRLDSLPGVFAAMYDENLTLLSERVTVEGERGMDPRSHPDFLSLASEHEQGEIDLVNWQDAGVEQATRLYYRWIPTGEFDHKLLLVVAMSLAALEINPSNLLVTWCVSLLAVAAFTVSVSLVVLVHHRHEPGGGVRIA